MKKKVTNTEGRDGALTLGLDALFGGAGAIERQEARGARELQSSEQLPVNGLDEARCEELGIVIKGPSEGDPLFVDVVFPEGAEIKLNPDDPRGSELIVGGEVVATMFYKAAAYDRYARISWTQEA
jgi:hypothetical protein